MEFNLDFLKQTGEALTSFGKKDEEKIKDYSNTGEEDDLSTQESVTPIVLDKSDDEKTSDEENEVIQTKTEKEKKEKKEDSLEKKLANIEKVIDKFGGGGDVETIPTKDMFAGSSNSNNINVKPLDMSNVQAKEVLSEYLKPSVNSDRVGLLYENLRKLNLI